MTPADVPPYLVLEYADGGTLKSRLDEARAHRLTSIEGLPPDLIDLPKGCPFYARCHYRVERCATENPNLEPVGPGHRIACWVDVTKFRLGGNGAGQEVA